MNQEKNQLEQKNFDGIETRKENFDYNLQIKQLEDEYISSISKMKFHKNIQSNKDRYIQEKLSIYEHDQPQNN